MRQKQWKDITDTQKRGLVLLGALQLALLAAALFDIRRRPADAINGSKRLWTMVVFINFVGPIAYFLFGRKRPERSQIAV
jgi:Phospholipase_D-nuclease N-terminal